MGTISVSMRFFLVCYSLSIRISSGTGSKKRSRRYSNRLAASVTDKKDGRAVDERSIAMLTVMSGGLQLYRNPGKNSDRKSSLTTETYFHCSAVEAAADAAMNAAWMVNAK